MWLTAAGRSTCGTADFGAISRDFDRKISRPRNFFENFGQKFAANRTESHVPRHADARHSVWGPLRVVARLQHVWHSGFRCDLARFRSQNFATAKLFRKFRSEIRRESHRISRAAACRRSAQCLGTSEGRGQAAARVAQRISARFRTKNFATAKLFRKVRSEIRRESHRISDYLKHCMANNQPGTCG